MIDNDGREKEYREKWKDTTFTPSPYLHHLHLTLITWNCVLQKSPKLLESTAATLSKM